MKLLQIAGMDVQDDLSDTTLVETLTKVIETFDPSKKLKDEDQAFSIKLTKFNYQARDKMLRFKRQAYTQKADKNYLNQLAQREGISNKVNSTNENVEKLREQQVINTTFLRERFEQIK